MNVDWKAKKQIEEVIDDIAFSRIDKFYPTIISKITGIPLEIVFGYLKELVDQGTLHLWYEIKCPNYECFNRIAIVKEKDIDNYYGKYIECPECEKDILISIKDIFPVFQIDKEYRSYIRNTKKKTVQSYLKVF